MATNNRVVRISEFESTVGDAELRLHYLPPRTSFLRYLGFNTWLLRKWMGDAVQLAKTIKPHLIRCYRNTLNGLIASNIEKALDVPLAISPHCTAGGRP